MALSGVSLTSMADALKIIYDPREVKLQAYKNNPLLAMLPKWEGFGGEAWHIGLWHYTDQGVGNTVQAAMDAQSAVGVEKFTITERKKKYAIHRIDAEAMKASARDPHSFLSGRKMLMDQGIHNLGREVSLDLYRDGGGSRGTIATGGISGSVVTLANPEDIVHFEVGQKLRATNGSAITDALHATTYTVNAVDRSGGKITLDAVTSLAAGNHFVRASFDYATGTSYKGIVGLGGWLPATVTSTSFFGVDRTVDTTRLGGLRYDGTGKTVEDAFLSAGALCFREGARPDKIFLNPVHEVELVKSLGAKAQYFPVKDPEGIVGFDALKIRTAAGTMDVISDPNCPPGVAYMLTMNSFKLGSLGPAPHLVDEDGLVLERISNSDAYQVRWRLWGELGCYAPGMNCRVTLDT